MSFEKTYTQIEPGSATAFALADVGTLMTQVRKLSPRMTTASLTEGRAALERLIPAAQALLALLPGESTYAGPDPRLTPDQTWLLRRLAPGLVKDRIAIDCTTEHERRVAGQLVHAGYGFTMTIGPTWKANGPSVLRFVASDDGAAQHGLIVASLAPVSQRATAR